MNLYIIYMRSNYWGFLWFEVFLIGGMLG